MDTVKERAFGAVFELNRIYAQYAVLIYTERPHNFSAYVSLVRPCRTSPLLPASALRKFPAFHIDSPFHEVFTDAIPLDKI